MQERANDTDSVAPIRVVLVDDHTIFRQGLRQALVERGIEIIGEASNGQSGAKLVSELAPDVAVLDLHMPLMDGIGATRAIVERDPKAKVLMLTISTEQVDVLDALAAGASGYVLKTSAPEDVVRAIEAAHAGDSAISPQVASRLVERLRANPAASAAPQAAAAVALTPREIEILRLVAEGKENAEIGRALYISASTAKNHVGHVLDKLGVENRVQAAVYAVRAGIV
jgi:DNA-binding NarL/FixJ family response regulator